MVSTTLYGLQYAWADQTSDMHRIFIFSSVNRFSKTAQNTLAVPASLATAVANVSTMTASSFRSPKKVGPALSARRASSEGVYKQDSASVRTNAKQSHKQLCLPVRAVQDQEATAKGRLRARTVVPHNFPAYLPLNTGHILTC